MIWRKEKIMKRKWMYFLPFTVIPCAMLALELLDDSGALRMSPYILGGVLLLLSAMAGFLSPAGRACDYIMTGLVPLAFFCTMFVAGFFDPDDLGSRFHIDRAISASLQPICIVLYILMAGVTLGASFAAFGKNKKSDGK